MYKLNFPALRKKIDSLPVPVSDYDVIEKERELEARPVIYLDGDLEKVKKSAFNIPLDDEMKSFLATKYTSGPFIHYQLQDLLILKNRIYFDNYEYQLNPLKRAIRFYDEKEIEEFKQASLSSMRISTVFFGHWLHEELQLIDYLQGKENIVSTSPPTQQKLEIKELFNLDFKYSPMARIKAVDMYHGWQHSEVFVDILKKYKQKISLLGQKNRSEQLKIVYLKRGELGVKRVLNNEKQLLELLDKEYNLQCFVAESTLVTQLYAAIYSADIVMGVDGSHLAHTLIAGRPGATFLGIQPPDRFYNAFRHYCDDAGLRYSVFVAEQGLNEQEFSVDITRVKLLIDKIESVM